MKKTYTETYCDVCGKSGARTYKTIALRTHDANDGRVSYDPPHIEQLEVDLCEYCAIRSSNLLDVGICCRKFNIDRKINEKYFGVAPIDAKSETPGRIKNIDDAIEWAREKAKEAE